MSKDFISVKVKCPYYRNVTDFSINCRDDTDTRTAYILSKVFKSKYKFKENLYIYCCEDYKKCEIYKILEKRSEKEA